jgi:hypothetical protein
MTGWGPNDVQAGFLKTKARLQHPLEQSRGALREKPDDQQRPAYLYRS